MGNFKPIKMVVKTVKCISSGKEIYPGHGKLQIRKDGRQIQFIDQKSQSLFNQGKKTAKITWTRNWRVLNKKVKIVREAKKIQRAIAGLNLEELKKKKDDSFKKSIRLKRNNKFSTKKQKTINKGSKTTSSKATNAT